MKFLCLAYGAESDWNALTSEEQAARLAQDEIIRKRGALMAALGKNVVTVTAWDGRPELTAGSFATSKRTARGLFNYRGRQHRRGDRTRRADSVPAHERRRGDSSD